MMTVQTELRSSTIHGVGLFALHPIMDKETVYYVNRDFDREYSEDELRALPNALLTYLYPYIWRSKVSRMWIYSVDNARFFNHSDTPNCTFQQEHGFANRLIEVGEELTCDYRDFDDLDLSEGNLFEWIREVTGVQESAFDKALYGTLAQG